MYLLYADFGREGEQSILISQSKQTLESIISDVTFHHDDFYENIGKHTNIPELISYIIKEGILGSDLKIKEIKEV